METEEGRRNLPQLRPFPAQHLPRDVTRLAVASLLMAVLTFLGSDRSADFERHRNGFMMARQGTSLLPSLMATSAMKAGRDSKISSVPLGKQKLQLSDRKGKAVPGMPGDLFENMKEVSKRWNDFRFLSRVSTPCHVATGPLIWFTVSTNGHKVFLERKASHAPESAHDRRPPPKAKTAAEEKQLEFDTLQHQGGAHSSDLEEFLLLLVAAVSKDAARIYELVDVNAGGAVVQHTFGEKAGKTTGLQEKHYGIVYLITKTARDAVREILKSLGEKKGTFITPALGNLPPFSEKLGSDGSSHLSIFHTGMGSQKSTDFVHTDEAGAAGHGCRTGDVLNSQKGKRYAICGWEQINGVLDMIIRVYEERRKLIDPSMGVSAGRMPERDIGALLRRLEKSISAKDKAQPILEVVTSDDGRATPFPGRSSTGEQDAAHLPADRHFQDDTFWKKLLNVSKLKGDAGEHADVVFQPVCPDFETLVSDLLPYETMRKALPEDGTRKRKRTGSAGKEKRQRKDSASGAGGFSAETCNVARG